MTNKKTPKKILLFGTGNMATEYIKVLFFLGISPEDIIVIGRTHEHSAAFTKKFGVTCFSGGTSVLGNIPPVKLAIVAVSIPQLYDVTLALLKNKCSNILLEKPGALYRYQLEDLEKIALMHNAKIFIAFNRRFYPSIEAAQKIITADGGLLSCHFDFTEIEELIHAGKYPEDVLSRWGVVNPIHIIDIFLHLAGCPTEWAYRYGGSLSWHKTSAEFCGSGITKRGVFFSYLSAWNGAGRWSVEFTTPRRKLLLQPIETLKCQYKGSFNIEEVKLAPEPQGLKPGIAGQVKAFLASENGIPDPRLCPLSEAVGHYQIVEKIMGYI